jgi:hypothetical protein
VLVAAGVGAESVEVGSASEAVIEKPVIYPGGRTRNPNDILKVALSAGEWAGRFKVAGLSIRYVEPRNWKGTIKAEIVCDRTLAKLTESERKIYDAVRLAPSKKHNLLDAIGIGFWACGR